MAAYSYGRSLLFRCLEADVLKYGENDISFYSFAYAYIFLAIIVMMISHD